MAGARTQAAGIKKRKAARTVNKTNPSTRARTAKTRGRTTRRTATPQPDENEEDDVVEQEGNDQNGDTPDDNDWDDPLEGVSDPLKRLQIKALIADEKRKMAEEKRKQELHDLEIRQRETQVSGTARPTVASGPGDDFGECFLSSTERQQVLSFPMIPKKHVIAIARNTFDPGNLPYLENLLVDDLTSDVTISFEDGKLKQSKNVGKASAIKTPAIWSKNFITYVRVVSIFHGVQHPRILDKLLEFHNIVVELSQTYDWQKAVLPLALLFHRTALHKGFADLDAWELPANMIDRYCRSHLKPTSSLSHGLSSANRRTIEDNPSNKSGVVCMNFNYKSCTSDRCKRDHRCVQCGGDHSAKTCTHKGKNEKGKD
jgi:hypothetical protein